MKINSSEKISYTKNNDFKVCSVDENKNIERLVNIQNDCFSDHYGYEINSIKDFREELNYLKHTNIKSFLISQKVNLEFGLDILGLKKIYQMVNQNYQCVV